MADIFRDQDHNLNKIVNADLTLIDPFLLPPDVLLQEDITGATGISVVYNPDGTVTIGASGPSGPAVGWLDDLLDVDTSTTGPTGGDVLLWDETIGQWVPGAQTGAGGYREQFVITDPLAELPYRVFHNLGVISGIVDVTVAEIGTQTKLIQTEVIIINENVLDVVMLGAVAGTYEVLVMTDAGTTLPPPPAQVGYWDPVVTYNTGDQALWPKVGPVSLWEALRTTINEEPGIPGDTAWTHVYTWTPVPGGIALDDLTDVNTTLNLPVTGNTLVYNGGQWFPGVASTVASLDDLTDVTTSSTGPTGPSGPTDGQVLVWNAALGQWVPGTGATPEAEVEVNSIEPTGPWELWVDTSALKPPPGAVAGLAIDNLTDVDTGTTGPVEGSGLGWNDAAGQWVPQAVWKSWSGTQAEYDALGTYSDTTLYAII